jgi:hypothetical protein
MSMARIRELFRKISAKTLTTSWRHTLEGEAGDGNLG